MRAVFIAVAVAFLGGCATQAGDQKATSGAVLTPQQAVMARAQARWDALLAGDVDKAYEFISPGARLAMPVAAYRQRVNPQYWRGTKVKDASCEAEICEVRLDFDYQLQGLPLSQVITEKWILDGGNWWFVYRG